MDVGFIGLGHMGSAIAANLVKAGHAARVWNRSGDKAKPLVEAGAAQAESPAGAAQAGVAITMLSDDPAVESVTFGEDGVLAGLPRGGLHIGMSTISVDLADRLAAAHAERGQSYISAPVFGRPAAAQAAKLFVVTAGPEAERQRVQPLFDAVGQKTFAVGDKPSAANLVKLCGNFMIMAAIESMSEAMAVAAKGGVDKAALLEVLTGTLFSAPIYSTYGEILLKEQFRPAGFAAPLGLKDMRTIGQAAEKLRVPMPVLGVIRDNLLSALATEGEDVDWSAIALAVNRNAGL